MSEQYSCECSGQCDYPLLHILMIVHVSPKHAIDNTACSCGDWHKKLVPNGAAAAVTCWAPLT